MAVIDEWYRTIFLILDGLDVYFLHSYNPQMSWNDACASDDKSSSNRLVFLLQSDAFIVWKKKKDELR